MDSHPPHWVELFTSWRASPVYLALLGLAVVSCSVLASRLVLRIIYDPLAAFPGPPLARWTRWHSVRVVWSGREHELIQAAHEKYGPVIRWQPNLLLVSDPQFLPIIYHYKANKTPHYNMSTTGVEGLVEAEDWEKHREFKKRIAYPFSLSAAQKDEGKIDVLITKWMDKLEHTFARAEKVFDFTHWTLYLFHDINSMRFFGKPFGLTEKGGDLHSLIRASQEGANFVHALARLPWLKGILLDGFLGRWLAPKSNDGTPFGDVLKIRDDLIDARLAAGRAEKSRGDGLDYLLYESRNADGSPIPVEEIREDALFLLLAGSETLGHTLRSILTLVYSHPSVLHSLEAEVLSVSTTSPIPFSHARTLPYLNACIREAERYDPAVVSYLPRYANSGDIELLGQPIPATTELASTCYVINRDKGTFGPDAAEFRPERYLDTVWAKEVEKREMVFGYGRRKCLARDLSGFLLVKTVFEFVRRFELEVLDAGQKEAYMFWIVKGITVKLKLRDQVKHG